MTTFVSKANQNIRSTDFEIGRPRLLESMTLRSALCWSLLIQAFLPLTAVLVI